MTFDPGAAPTAEVVIASHDPDVTPELRALMTKGWAAPPGAGAAGADPVAPYCLQRRARLSAAFPGDVLVVPSGNAKVRSNDTYYSFRPASDHVWLTGNVEPDAVLVMTPSAEGHEAVLFARPRSDRSTEAFYRDRNHGELWIGPRPSLDDIAARLAITTRPLGELESVLASFAGQVVRVVPGHDAAVDAVADGTPEHHHGFSERLAELRLIKDEQEVAEIEKAIAATVRGFEECVRELPVAESERWIEGTFFRRARTDGNDIGYGSIVACGHHGTYLHWTHNDGAVRPGELALLDMGVEAVSLYTADVTRTIPIGGRFTEAQRKVYDAVVDAQQAGIDAVRSGADFLAPHRAAMAVLAQRLIDWGILTQPLDEVLATQVHRRYTLHGTSHMLGLDVHDCAQARNEMYRGGTLAAGMVLTVEPGLYFQVDDLTVPEELRGVGVRIEDDVVVTADGVRVLSDALPKRADEVEAWMALLQRG
jgi:Xaa-Pro aminopeptidase